MSDDLNEKNKSVTDSANTPETDGISALAASRRRLFKRGIVAAPVVLTLVSRPVLAWHCKSPSAWGSEIINPNTSLKGNAGHATYVDETWTITNWKSNTPRTENWLDDEEIVTGKPWRELRSVYPALKNDETKTASSNNSSKFYFDYSKVTVAHLSKHVLGFINPGFADTLLIKDLPSDDPKTYALVAQLNYVVLKQVKANNDIDKCITGEELQQMASGTYFENGVAWGLGKAKDYFYNNWIVRP